MWKQISLKFSHTHNTENSICTNFHLFQKKVFTNHSLPENSREDLKEVSPIVRVRQRFVKKDQSSKVISSWYYAYPYFKALRMHVFFFFVLLIHKQIKVRGDSSLPLGSLFLQWYGYRYVRFNASIHCHK